jgi:acyl-coenzyme A thioesterase PaaI-like protein
MKKIINPWLGLTDKGYNCFACAPGNPYGLKMEFYEDGDDIVSFWTPDDNYQGWMNTLHGGIQATIMDECAGWLIARKFQTSGMTTNLNIKYKKPIPTGSNVKIEIRARVKEQKRNFVIMEATISHEGTICSAGELTFFCFNKDIAEKDFYFTGCEVED